MPLTATEIVDIRKMIGDTDAADYFLEDTELDTLNDAASGKRILTVLYALRRILGLMRVKIDKSNTAGGSNGQYNQLFTQTKELHDMYYEIWKDSGGSILAEDDGLLDPSTQGMGSLSTDIDYTDTDYEAGLY